MHILESPFLAEIEAAPKSLLHITIHLIGLTLDVMCVFFRILSFLIHRAYIHVFLTVSKFNKMNKTLFALALFIFASFGLQAQIYIGASVGNSFVNKNLEDVNGDDFTVDENAFAYKVYAGYSTKFLGIEGGYRDLGEAKRDVDLGKLRTKITGFDVAARGKVNLGPVFAFAKAGAFFAKYENEIGTYSYSENSTNFLWGLGAGLQLNRLGIRLEYEGLGKESNSLSMLTAGLSFNLSRTEEEME